MVRRVSQLISIFSTSVEKYFFFNKKDGERGERMAGDAQFIRSFCVEFKYKSNN